MQGGCSIRGCNSSAAHLSWHCGVAFMAVAPKKRAEKLFFLLFYVDFQLSALSFSTSRAKLRISGWLRHQKRRAPYFLTLPILTCRTWLTKALSSKSLRRRLIKNATTRDCEKGGLMGRSSGARPF